MKIAVVQFDTVQFQPEENIRKAEDFIRRAADNNANLVVFPEDFLTGPIKGKDEFVDFKGKYRKIFQQFAKKYNKFSYRS